jgi:hypothetical protein
MLRIDKIPHFSPGLLIGLRSFYAKVMYTPVNVAIVKFIVLADSIDYLTGLLRRGGIIEINEGSFVDQLLKDGKIGTNLIYVKWYRSHNMDRKMSWVENQTGMKAK